MNQIFGTQKTAAPVIKDTTIATFEADVLAASMEIPVIVDFWAEWCGPCKQLTPMLEKAVNAAGGKVRLVKVDIDANQMLATQLRIQSVPTVYAFYQGRPVDGFQGAVPESEVKAFIGRLLALNEGDGAGDIADHIDAAEAMFAEGDLAGAAELYGRIAEADASNVKALAGLARCHVSVRDFVQAEAILDLIPQDKRNDPSLSGVSAAIALAKEGSAGDPRTLGARVEQNPQDLGVRFELAGALIGSGDMEAAVDQLLTIIERDRSWNEDAARKKLLTAFDALGPTHPLTLRGRRRLSSILFS